MHIDLLIFAIIAAFLVYRLHSVLGTRHGDERQRPNPFAPQQAGPPQKDGAPRAGMAVAPRTVIDLKATAVSLSHLIDEAANAGGRIDTGLAEIAEADPQFSPVSFMEGARSAFEMVVTAYNKGDLALLKTLVSPKLFKDFESGVRAREAQGHTAEITIHRISAARIIEAHLGGTVSYITVDYDVEETTVTRDASGAVVAGDPDHIFSVKDVWTFMRDVRSEDPNWVLIETRAADVPSASA